MVSPAAAACFAIFGEAFRLVAREQLARKPATMLLFEMHVGKRLLVASLTTKQRTGAAESGAALLPYPSQHATPGKPRPPANMAMRNMPSFAILASQARLI
jgi:hypothetical protein